MASPGGEQELDAMRKKVDAEYASQLQALRSREDELRLQVQRREQVRNKPCQLSLLCSGRWC